MIADRGRATFEVGSQIFIDKKEKGRREQVTERIPLLIIVVSQKSHLPPPPTKKKVQSRHRHLGRRKKQMQSHTLDMPIGSPDS